ncbi:MAG: phosphoglycerate mutase, partial [Clostridia bacterium]|nr:phosphoglycerate mutase [Clostridia bacterium]
MKYLILLGDGMADRPSEALGQKTPLQLAKKPHFDALAQQGTVGTVRTVPHGMPCGSDTANLGVLGYDQTKYYSGRSPLEAVSMGIDMKPDDVAFRCNLVTLSDEEEYAAATMVDYSSDEISTAESTQLIRYLDEHLRGEGLRLYPGISYRHCLIFPNAQTGTVCTP